MCEPKQMEDVREELQVMQQCSSLLYSLKPEAAARVVDWLEAQFSPQRLLRDRAEMSIRKELEAMEKKNDARAKLRCIKGNTEQSAG